VVTFYLSQRLPAKSACRARQKCWLNLAFLFGRLGRLLGFGYMHSDPQKWDRQELYEKVWQYPLRKLAVEYGISDVALANVCRKLQIPLPGLGHWTKIQCGHKIPTPVLQAAKDLPVLLRPTPREKTPLLTEDSPKLERSSALWQVQPRT
jgi:hypothetical protein